MVPGSCSSESEKSPDSNLAFPLLSKTVISEDLWKSAPLTLNKNFCEEFKAFEFWTTSNGDLKNLIVNNHGSNEV